MCKNNMVLTRSTINKKPPELATLKTELWTTERLETGIRTQKHYGLILGWDYILKPSGYKIETFGTYPF